MALTISLILALSENCCIGKDNQLPWHLPADLKHFKSITLNHTILMGRKTHESIGRALPDRKNIVITHDQHYKAPGCEIFYSLEEALKSLNEEQEVFVIGGANLYKQMIDYATRLYLTIIHAEIEGDTFFHPLDFGQWKLVSKETHAKDDKNPYAYSFNLYERF